MGLGLTGFSGFSGIHEAMDRAFDFNFASSSAIIPAQSISCEATSSAVCSIFSKRIDKQKRKVFYPPTSVFEVGIPISRLLEVDENYKRCFQGELLKVPF